MATPEISRGLGPEEVVADRYVVRRRLGAGGMGEAWLAEDRILHRKLVLKQLKGADAVASSDSARATQNGHLLSEAKRAAAIDSPHIAQVYDVCSHRGEWLVAMEYVAGQNLRSALATPLRADTFFSLAVQIAEAIAAAHASGVLHCDIKPENIMVTEHGFVKVLDFGLARMMAGAENADETVSLAAAHAFAGTPGYIAPEVLRENPPTEQSDIFSLGVVLYEMAGGKAPFKGKTLADSVQMTLTSEAGPLDLKSHGLPADVGRVLQKALMKDPVRRYGTVRDLLVDLKNLQQGAPALAGGSATRAWRLWAAAGVAAFLALGGGALWWMHTRGQHPAAATPARVSATPGMRLLAVLPFQVIPADAQLSAYSEGLRDAITATLAQVAPAAKIEVLAASEVRAHRLTTPEEAHKELGADLVIDGSYEQHANQVRIRYELTDASARVTGQPGEVRSTSDDPFKLEDDVVAGVLQMLRVSTASAAPAPPAASAHSGTQVPAAYEAYLQGLGYLRDFDITDNLKKAEEQFAAATRADPQFASAYAGLGEAQWAIYRATSDPSKVAEARESCGKAMALNAQVAEAQICEGTVDDGTGNAKRAQQEFQEALRLDPQSDTALNGLARTYEEMEEPEEARKVYQQAIEARPYYWANDYALANFLIRRADYSQAATVLEQAVAKFPANSFLMRRLGVAYFLEGKLDEAAATFQSAIQASAHAEAYLDLGQVYLHQRKFAPAITALESAARLKPHSYPIEADLADAYAWNGETARAKSHYQEALRLSQADLKVNAQDLDAMMVEAYSAAALSQQSAALDALDAALQHAPEDAEVNYYAARVYARLGDQGAARDWARKAIAHGYSKADIDSAPDMKGIAPPAG
ncbi:MAG: protein kinase domain-containing protein [Acidobacteriota bacterium]